MFDPCRLACRAGILSLFLSASTGLSADIAEDFAREAIYEDVLISPSGKYLAVVYRSEGEEFLSVLDRSSSKHLSKLGFGDRMGIIDVVWANDERLLIWPAQRFWYSDSKLPTGEIIGINANGKKHKRLFGWQAGDTFGTGRLERGPERTYGWARLVDILPNDEHQILIEVHSFSDRGQASRAVHMDVRTGRQRDLIGSPVREGAFVASIDGDVEVSYGFNTEAKYALFHRPDATGWFEPVMVRAQDEGRLVPFGAYDASRYLVADDEDARTEGVSLWNPKTNHKELLFRHPRVDVLDAHFGWQDRSPYALGYVDHFPNYYYPDAEHPLATVHLKIRAAFPDDDVILTSSTRDNDLAVALVSGDRNPGTFYLVDVKAGSIARIQDRRPWLAPEGLAVMEPVALTVRDKTPVSGYLTTPKGASRPGPLVVLVHGGPHMVQDVWGFNDDVQFLAAAGYSVLQVNFRGSSGFGREFEAAGYREWGAAMQDDVTDATLWAIAEGIADPKRICIFGASYGAYAALTGAFREPDLYQCAIGYVGVYDLPLMFERGDIRKLWMGQDYLQSTLGTDPETLKARSPVFHAQRIKADVMLVAGELDDRAPIEHSERMRDALEATGKKVEWIVEKGEGHGFFNAENRANLYRNLAAFLQRSIGP